MKRFCSEVNLQALTQSFSELIFFQMEVRRRKKKLKNTRPMLGFEPQTSDFSGQCLNTVYQLDM